MGWSGFPLAADADWSSLTYLNQVTAAISERALAMDSGGFEVAGVADFTAGEMLLGRLKSMQGATLGLMDTHAAFVDLQLMGVFNRPDLVESITGLEAGTFLRRMPRTVADTSDDGSLGDRAYLGAWNSEDDERSDNHDSDKYEHDGSGWVLSEDQLSPVDVTEHRGGLEKGDYLGPWLLNDMYTMLNCIHTCRVHLVASGSYERWYGQSGFETTQAAAEAAAIADFQLLGTYVPPTSRFAVTDASVARSGSGSTSGKYKVQVRRYIQQLTTAQYVAGEMTNSSLPYVIEIFPAYPAGDGGENTDRQDGGDASRLFIGHIDDYDVWAEPRWRPPQPMASGTLLSVGSDVLTGTVPPNIPTHPGTLGTSVGGGWSGRYNMEGLITFTFEYRDGLPGGGLT